MTILSRVSVAGCPQPFTVLVLGGFGGFVREAMILSTILDVWLDTLDSYTGEISRLSSLEAHQNY
jgi:hypothetical protein